MKRNLLWIALAWVVCLFAPTLALSEGAPASVNVAPITAAYDHYSLSPAYVPVGMAADEAAAMFVFAVASNAIDVTHDETCYRALFDGMTLSAPDGGVYAPRFAIVPAKLGESSFRLLFDDAAFGDGRDGVDTDQFALVFAVPKGADFANYTLVYNGGEVAWNVGTGEGVKVEDALPSPKALLDAGAKAAAEKVKIAQSTQALNTPLDVVPSVALPGVPQVAPQVAPQPEPAPEPEPEPEPDPDARDRQLVNAFIDDAFSAQIAKETDPWTLYALSSGRDGEEIALSKPDKKGARTATATFKLCLYDGSSVKAKAYDSDDKYLAAVLDACGKPLYEGKLTVTIAEKNGETTLKWGKNTFQAMYKKVKSAAAKAKKVFAGKAIQNALLARVFPSPMTAPKKAPDVLTTDALKGKDAWALRGVEGDDVLLIVAAMYAQKNAAIDVSEGPGKFALTFSAPDPAALAKAARKAAAGAFAKVELANQYEEEKIDAAFLPAFQAEAIAFRHGKDKGETRRWALDMDALIIGNAPADGEMYLSGWLEASHAQMDALREAVWEMPDYPRLDFPKTGRLTGSKSGQKVAFKMPKDGNGHYLRLDSADKKGVVSAFIRSGETVTLYVPANVEYAIVLGEGKEWYGKNHLFGEMGGYSIADQTIQLDKTGNSSWMQYTITTEGTGNPLNYADLDDILN